MGWLEDGIVQFIANVYEGLFYNVQEIFDLAKLSPSGFNSTLWQAVTDFNELAVLPVSWSILTLFLLLELANLMKRSDAKGGLESIYWVSKIILKILIAKTCMDNMTTIINALFEISGQIVLNGESQLAITEKTIDTNSITDALEHEKIVSLLGYFLQAFLIQLCSSVCFILAKIVIQLRFIEIYIFAAIAALPFATLASQEYSSIGKNYIKRMAALAIHAVFIIVVVYVYSVLLNGAIFNIEDGSVTSSMWDLVGYSILFVIALFQTGGWSKSLMQAN